MNNYIIIALLTSLLSTNIASSMDTLYEKDPHERSLSQGETIKLGGQVFYKFATPGGGLCGYFAGGIKPKSYDLYEIPDSTEIARVLKNHKITCGIFEANMYTVHTISLNDDISFTPSTNYFPGKDVYMHLTGEHYSFLVPTTSTNRKDLQKGMLLQKLVSDIKTNQRFGTLAIHKLYDTYFDAIKKLNDEISLTPQQTPTVLVKKIITGTETEMVNDLVKILDNRLLSCPSTGVFFPPQIIMHTHPAVREDFETIYGRDQLFFMLLTKAQKIRENRKTF